MLVVIVGAGRVGSSLAKWALGEGHQVSVLDEDPLSLDRLNQDMTTTWEDAGGRFTVGTALEIDALHEAGVEDADACIVCTDGDNTNLVVAQIARRRFNVPKVIVRVLDPLRAEWYREQGLETICPTQVAIEMLKEAVAA
jgi:trk/ktr system potassium uptake protein